VLWSVLDAANYNYIIEWSFREDGSIGGRAGSTGPKLAGADDTRGHMHNFTWRIDIDLNGSDGDSALFTRHIELLSPPPSQGSDQEFLITQEGGRVWTATRYSTLKVVDATLQNGRGRQTAYELVPNRMGAARHTEAYTQFDFWVTRHNNTERFGSRLPAFVSPPQSTVGQDIVVWYTGSAHHEDNMRDEDRDTVPVLWTGFELVPHNLFDRTPLFP
jgi:Cu2+-containing amine oxidase